MTHNKMVSHMQFSIAAVKISSGRIGKHSLTSRLTFLTQPGMCNLVGLIFFQSASTTSTISPWEELSGPVRNHDTAERTPGPIRNTERLCGSETATEQ